MKPVTRESSPRDTKEQVWLVGRIEPPAEFMKGRAVWLYDPANPTEYPDYGDRLIPLTTAKEQVEAAEKERDEWQFSYRIALQAEVELRHKAESERDTALERAEAAERKTKASIDALNRERQEAAGRWAEQKARADAALERVEELERELAFNQGVAFAELREDIDRAIKLLEDAEPFITTFSMSMSHEEDWRKGVADLKTTAQSRASSKSSSSRAALDTDEGER